MTLDRCREMSSHSRFGDSSAGEKLREPRARRTAQRQRPLDRTRDTVSVTSDGRPRSGPPRGARRAAQRPKQRLCLVRSFSLTIGHELHQCFISQYQVFVNLRRFGESHTERHVHRVRNRTRRPSFGTYMCLVGGGYMYLVGGGDRIVPARSERPPAASPMSFPRP